MISIASRTAILSTVCSIALCVPAAAVAQSRTFDVPAQSASTGVRQLAQQAGIQIIVAGSATEGRETNAVKGHMDAQTALDRLLSGTGLSVRSFDGTIAILDAVENESSSVAEIVVTGSRIARPETASPMPVSVTNMDDAARIGRTTPYDALRLDPAIGQGVGIQNSYGQAYDAGLSSVALRNLGVNRSLTLIDGMRRVSGSARTSAVDLNMIPPAMVERMEVITGGAAAIYGADAVTGAVNVITKRNVDGLNLSFTQGISEYGDGEQTQVSMVTGGKFGDGRGSVVFGGTYSETGAISSQDRSFSKHRILFQANPANTGSRDGIPDLLLNRNQREILIGYLPNFYYAPENRRYVIDNGDVRLPQGGTELVGGKYGWYNAGEGRNLEDQRQLQGGLEALTALARADYDVSDNITYHAAFDFGRTEYRGTALRFREDDRPAVANNNGGDIAYLDNPYMPASLRQFMVANGLTQLNIDRTYGNFPPIAESHDREGYTGYQGLEGKLTEGLQWEAFFQYGRNDDDVTYTDVPRASRYAAARDAIADPVTGNPICRSETARANGCIPFSIFTTEPYSAAQLAYVLTDRLESRLNTQTIYGGNVTGKLFSLPYGDAKLALGVERRTETLKTRDDPLAASGEVAFFNIALKHPNIDASRSVTEAYGELILPVLEDLRFARRLEVEGAYRYSDYDSFGKTSTWKAGGSWEPIEGLTFRAVRSKSVRAPNFGELYEPQSITQQGTPDDPCLAQNYNLSTTRAANCRALGIVTPLEPYKLGGNIISGGNPNLTPETSNSFTAGLIFQPRFLRGLDLTVDYYNIDISDVIAAFTDIQIETLCVDLPTIDNKFCGLVQRDPATGLVTQVSTQQINAQKMLSRGIDIGASYTRPVGAGQMRLGFKGTWLLEQVVQTTPGRPQGDVNYDGGYLDPRFRATLLAEYNIGQVSIALNTRFVSAAEYDVNAKTDEQYSDNDIPARWYNDASANYAFDDRTSTTLGVRNLLDVDPPRWPGAVFGYSQYDVVGRYFYVNGTIKF